MKGFSYSFLDPNENVGVPPPMRHAGLYTSDESYHETVWSKDYRGPRIDPDAISYSQHYNELARGHIPTNVRPGNNSIEKNNYSFNDDKYNKICFKQA
jgi:hypothetical protein